MSILQKWSDYQSQQLSQKFGTETKKSKFTVDRPFDQRREYQKKKKKKGKYGTNWMSKREEQVNKQKPKQETENKYCLASQQLSTSCFWAGLAAFLS